MSQPKFTGVWIPAAVFNADQLTTSAKLLYGVVAGLDGDDGCYASNAYLQRLLGVSERGVQVLLMELEQFGLIVRAQEDGRRVIRTVEAMALGKCPGINRGGAENCTQIE
jgi:biotin operon repressor